MADTAPGRAAASASPASPASASPSAASGDADARGAIARLADELVPALSATLAASGLAEVELRQPGWRVRVRRAGDTPTRPAAAVEADGRGHRARAGDRSSRIHASDRGHGSRGVADASDHRDHQNGSGPSGRDRPRAGRDAGSGDRFRAIATSPAVGPFRPDRVLRRGARVRVGDRLGAVDVLGVPQEVMSPVDGIVMAVLVDADDAVEYGQPLVELERASATGGGGAAAEP